MGWDKIYRRLRVKGRINIGAGSVTFGDAEDTNLYRSAANTLKTDDALTVAGAFNASGAATVAGAFTAQGTPALVPYATASPTVDSNGQVGVYHKAGVAYLTFQSGGTPYVLGLPSATNGTLTITVNSVP